ncbi:winged helix-turn-helix transcriptional regulator [Acidianus ambivalens]|uniref:Transcriptional regulator n=1 Tax=Acidianus ambivalens TaxID=2283 RepID=A0A650CTC3_ACIAM|nr:helix-turn-helix domain-containing protein [Acidianus ambivalens]MDT7902092.1 helix-turn-helix domain-containing protein [Acidianus sp.]MQL55501.1 transcriptional regulator [Acidianus ambivalens]QGR21033.1 transcriptional regulator [Acidianus ambivalens]
MKLVTLKKLDTICPIVETIRIIGSEPKLLVLRYLLDGGKGFNELQRLTKLSSKTLSSTLKDLENNDLIKRIIISDRPFRVRYELTEKGKELKGVFEEIQKWGNKYLK